MKVKIVTAINHDIGTGHVSRMYELKLTLSKKLIDTEILLIDTIKNNKFLRKNNIKFKIIDLASYKKSNYFYILDLPSTYKKKYLKEKFGNKIYFYDRRNYNRTLRPKIIHKKDKIIFLNYYLPQIKNSFIKKYDILITSGSVTQINNDIINQNLKSKFKIKIVHPFLTVKNKIFYQK